MLFRVAGGYVEPSLRVTAACQTCSAPGQQDPIVFDPARAEPQGEDAPGSYYPLNITLPFAGRWQITVVAGADQATITVEVAGTPAG